MRRKEIQIISRDQKNDASCIQNHRGLARNAKRHGGKSVRQELKRDLTEASNRLEYRPSRGLAEAGRDRVELSTPQELETVKAVLDPNNPIGKRHRHDIPDRMNDLESRT